MENEDIKEIQIEEPQEETKIEETPQTIPAKEQPGFAITTPIAIVIAGVLIMGGILLTNGGGNKVAKAQTLSEQVGVNKDKFTQCMKDTDLNALSVKTNAEAEKAMKAVPANERGTPYAIIVGKNGAKTEVRGAYPKADVQKLIDEVVANKVTTAYQGDVTAYQEGDHILGNPEAPVMIIEYSDLECPFCKRFSGTMKEIVAESNGNVAWVYRHWIVHPGALAKAGAAECVNKLKGNDAFWKYIDLVFGLIPDQAAAPATSEL